MHGTGLRIIEISNLQSIGITILVKVRKKRWYPYLQSTIVRMAEY